MRPVSIILVLVLALGAVEAAAYWWMHPAPTGLGDPVLVYRPGESKELSVKSSLSEESVDISSTDNRQPTTDNSPSTPSTIDHQQSSIPPISPSSSPNQKSAIHNHQSSIPPSSLSTSSTTPLPEVYQQAAPMLRCTSGQVFHTQLDDTVGLHLAFFEWDGADTGSVLEAFRHMPEACMGSIGMTLVAKERSIAYKVRSRAITIRGQESGGGSKSAEPSSSHQPSTINHQQSSISPPATTLVFDHTIFREPGKGGGFTALGPQVHSFRAVWVAGLAATDARAGIGGDEFDRLRTIRLKSALSRFRPTHARVIQGAVRGAANGEAAWEAFENAMLNQLRMD